MNKLLFFILFCLTLAVNGQISIGSRFGIMADTLRMEEYKPEESPGKKFKVIKLKVNYGDFEILNKKDVEIIRNANISRIELVYTIFPKDQDFRALNKKRLEYLHLLCPEVFVSSITRWSIVGLTKCNSDYEAASMFHGFIITYLPGPTAESARAEFDFLRAAVSGKTTPTDSTIIKILNRNHFPESAVVADFTGSMSPYISQLLLWYNLTFAENRFSDFTFFNDGNTKPDDEKRVGSTGGIYYCKGGNRDSVLNAALNCVTNGYGGDVPENDVEAVLATIKKNPDIKEVVLIADNWAPMRDYGLISKITVPVHVIICGYSAYPYLNVQYLDLAYKTKGSLHTIEDDINNLKTLQEGKTIKIGAQEFRLKDGKFYKII